MTDLERLLIVGVAVKYRGAIWQLPKPARHHHVLWALDQVIPGAAIHAHEQGFIDETGRFVGRIGARQMAIDSGQCPKPSHSSDLFSEDLW